jgi:hypothetical protein
MRAVDLDSAHAKPELVGDHLIGAAVDQSLQYVAFARTKAIDATRGIGDLFGTNRCASAREGCVAPRSASSLSASPVNRTRFHGANGDLDISPGRHHDDRKIVSHVLQRLHDFNAVGAWKPKIKQDASFPDLGCPAQELVGTLECDRLETC